MPEEPENEYDHNPAQFLVENIGLLSQGRALDIAMGGGRNAVYLAKMGFTVEGVDSSESAIEHARQLAAENQVNILAEVADLELNYHIKPDTYDVILCFNYLQRSLIPQIRGGLKKGGLIVYETYTIDQSRFGRPHNPNFLLKYNELLEMFRGLRVLRYREGIFDTSNAIASLLAARV
jgi:tellurite methyltransferase